MERIANRHEGDLGGRFLPFADTEPAAVTVVVVPETAHLPAVQHTAWMLINLLARFDGVLEQVGLNCPPGVRLAGRIVPLAGRDLDLQSALLEGACEIGVVPVILNVASERMISVGGQGCEQATLFAYADAWWGGITTTPLATYAPVSPLPFGPYISACMAASEVFKAIRIRPEEYTPVQSAFYTAWQHQVSSEPATDGPVTLPNLPVELALAGVGAVGCAWMHTMWACPGVSGSAVLADNDPKGLEDTNLNRYTLFGQTSIGKAKASEAAQITSDADIVWHPQDGPFEDLPKLPPRVVSAVDTNRARAAIQNRYPGRIFSGSTHELRAEVLRCGPPGVGACLRCFNPPEEITSDNALREQLRHASPEELTHLAAKAGLSEAEARAWIEQGRCGMIGESLLSYLRLSDTGPQRFAVGFVSVMAGTLLAAETIKDHFAIDVPLSDLSSRALYQFWTPNARTNRATPYLRDSQCPMCKPGTEAVKIWLNRFQIA